MNRLLSIARPTALHRAGLLQTRSYASHGPTYDPPTGYIFGEKPPSPGQKRKWESWELIYYVGMFGGLAFASVIYIYKPDTSIQTWALEEARKRMEARGDLPKYVPSQPSTSSS